MLLVLDDAAGHEQVRPLLPGTPGSLVLITSRRRLTALEDAAVISLDTLPPGEAAALLVRLADPARPGCRATAARRSPGCAGTCRWRSGCSPASCTITPPGPPPTWPPTWPRPGTGWQLMQAENLSVAAAFDLSYQDLTAGQQRLFRRLGLHPGPDIDAYAAAALDDIDLAGRAGAWRACTTST